MKKTRIKFFSNVFAAIAIFGLLIAGSEHPSQLVTCTVGACLFAGGFYGIAAINRG